MAEQLETSRRTAELEGAPRHTTKGDVQGNRVPPGGSTHASRHVCAEPPYDAAACHPLSMLLGDPVAVPPEMAASVGWQVQSSA
jgi:hypothetical protein